MNIRLIVCLLLLTGLTGCSCKKILEEPTKTKPALTQDGRNTFYCEINGVPYYQRFIGKASTFPSIKGASGMSDTVMCLFLDIEYKFSQGPQYLFFTICKNNFTSDTIYFNERRNSTIFSNRKENCNYRNSVLKYGTFDGYIFFHRFDPEKSIFSGTFAFRNWFPDSVGSTCPPVSVTNGIFDVKI